MGVEKSIIAFIVLSLMCGANSAYPSNGKKRTLSWSTNETGTHLIVETTMGPRCLQWQEKFLTVFSSKVSLRKSYICSNQIHNVAFITSAMPQTLFLWRVYLSKDVEYSTQTSKSPSSTSIPLIGIYSDAFCPPKFRAIIRFFTPNVYARVVSRGLVSYAFKVDVGVKQDCVIATNLFNIYLTAVALLSQQILQLEDGDCLRYGLGSSVFNIRRFRVPTRANTKKV